MLLVQDESKYARNTQNWFLELWNSEVQHVLNDSNDILLDHAYDPDLIFFQQEC